jgi:hypothetical protein
MIESRSRAPQLRIFVSLAITGDNLLIPNYLELLYSGGITRSPEKSNRPEE